MPNAAIQVVIQPFTETFAQTGATPKVLKPFNMAETADPASRVVVTPPSGSGSAGGGSGPYVDGSVAVSGRGEIELTFTVVDNAVPPASYTLSGILFRLTSTAAAPATGPTPPLKTGRDSFPEFKCQQNGSLELKDKCDKAGDYQFMLLVQNSDGGVAIIDPQISNQ